MAAESNEPRHDSPRGAHRRFVRSAAACPVSLPVITVDVDSDVPDAGTVDRWPLSSDMYDRSERGGGSAHADWCNGWDADVVDTWLDHCYTPAADCDTNDLNDGTGLGGPYPTAPRRGSPIHCRGSGRRRSRRVDPARVALE